MEETNRENNEDLIEDLNDIRISEMFEVISTHLTKTLPDVPARLADYGNLFEETFPKLSSPPKRFSDLTEEEVEQWFTRRIAGIFNSTLMRGPLLLYALRLNGLAIVELHGLLEQFVLDDISKLLGSTKEKATILRKRLLQRQSLQGLAQILVDLHIWDHADLKFIEKLCGLRNALAHKNAERISNLVYSGRPIPVSKIDKIMTNVDCLPDLIQSLRLLTKLVHDQLRGSLYRVYRALKSARECNNEWDDSAVMETNKTRSSSD